MKPFFSIIIPVYQAEKSLERCVQSVLTQECSDYEILLVDDGSTDNSGTICDAFAERDARVKVIHQPNAGVSLARNAGIQMATGEYLLFLDSDDALMPQGLTTLANATNNGIADVVIAGLSVLENGMAVRKIGLDKEMQSNREIWEMICRDSAPFGYAGGKIIRRGIVNKHAVVFNANMHSQEDLDFFLSGYGFSKTIHVIPDCVYAYYYAPTNRTPRFGDYIANQIKLLRVVNMCTEVSVESIACVYQRICSLIYTGLYCAVEENTYLQTLETLLQIKDLKTVLADASVQGEHGFVVRNFVAGRYRCIRWYFAVRNQIWNAARRIKKR